MSSLKFVGSWGEALAASHLEKIGYTILGRNVRTPYGEIDLIARQGIKASNQNSDTVKDSAGVLVFIEVKTRRNRTFGLPEVSITPKKRAHLLAAIAHYIQQHPHLEGERRVDVIAIQRYDPNQPPTITHFENAIS